MVFTIGLGDAIWSGRIPGASFFIMMIVIIKSSPETIKQICFLLNYEVNNTRPSSRTLHWKAFTCSSASSLSAYADRMGSYVLQIPTHFNSERFSQRPLQPFFFHDYLVFLRICCLVRCRRGTHVTVPNPREAVPKTFLGKFLS